MAPRDAETRRDGEFTVDSTYPDGGFANGCRSYPSRVVAFGADIDGDTWDTYARSFFQDWCVSCHATTLTGTARGGAPAGLNWDDQATVLANLGRIRNVVAVSNFMPIRPPSPPCSERLRLARWIDAQTP